MPRGVENSALGFDMEIDEDEVPFSYHKRIELPNYLDVTTKQKLQTSIEKKLVAEINKVLDKTGVSLESIEVTVDVNGAVVITSVKGKNLPKDVVAAITSLIEKQEYSKFKIHYVWKYVIVF
jgi:hypothetical protein